MSNQVKITAVVTSVAKGAAQALNVSPFLGGRGKKMILRNPVPPLTSTVVIEGAPSTDPATGIAPVAGSSLWTALATFTSSSEQQAEVLIPDLIRYNCTVLDADGPDVIVYAEAMP